MNSINIDELLNKLKTEKLNIIDIRTNTNYQYGHIPTAININKTLLINSPEKYLDKTKVYYIYCQSGHSSLNIVNLLNKQGYNTINITGGYNNYNCK